MIDKKKPIKTNVDRTSQLKLESTCFILVL